MTDFEHWVDEGNKAPHFNSQKEAHEYLRKLGTPKRVIHPTVVYQGTVTVGMRVAIGAFSKIGGYGFGFDPKSNFTKRWSHSGEVVLSDDVEIGSNTCVDGGTIGATTIGKNTKIDNLVHIAHNVVIGRNVLIVAGTVVGGSVVIGSNVFIGEGVRIKDHVKIGNNVVLGQGSNILKDVPNNTQVISKVERIDTHINIRDNILPLGYRLDLA